MEGLSFQFELKRLKVEIMLSRNWVILQSSGFALFLLLLYPFICGRCSVSGVVMMVCDLVLIVGQMTISCGHILAYVFWRNNSAEKDGK